MFTNSRDPSRNRKIPDCKDLWISSFLDDILDNWEGSLDQHRTSEIACSFFMPWILLRMKVGGGDLDSSCESVSHDCCSRSGLSSIKTPSHSKMAASHPHPIWCWRCNGFCRDLLSALLIGGHEGMGFLCGLVLSGFFWNLSSSLKL